MVRLFLAYSFGYISILISSGNAYFVYVLLRRISTLLTLHRKASCSNQCRQKRGTKASRVYRVCSKLFVRSIRLTLTRSWHLSRRSWDLWCAPSLRVSMTDYVI